jgi:hypothetical protein
MSLAAGAAAAGEPLDLGRTSSLTISPGSASLSGLEEADVTIDVYRVASATASSGAFVFEPFNGVELSDAIRTYEGLSSMKSSDWEDLAQMATKSLFMPYGEIAEEPVMEPEHNLSALPAGLYLVIARGSELSPRDYLLYDDDGHLMTCADSGGYRYTWLPELIALPATVDEITGELDEDGNRQPISTDFNSWFYNIRAVLKAAKTPMLGDLEIIKILQQYETGDPVTVTFRVHAELGGATVYDDIVSLTFTPETGLRRSALIRNKLPVGANVTVTEVDEGAGFIHVTPTTQTTVILPPFDANGDPQIASVEFTDTFNNDPRRGHGILNRFVYDAATKQWVLNNKGDSAT